jgi:dTDP-4-dehydrorhamnose reductase
MKRKKVLLFGAANMTGHITYLFLKDTGKYDITPVVYRNSFTENSIVIDVRDNEKISRIIKAEKPDFIINCIAILIEGTKHDPSNAIFINSYFPHLLVKIADEIDSKLIHISTDCVFSGKKGMYSEIDFKDADDLYGRSKALGEICSKNHLTIRTSKIGPELKKDGEELFHWFMMQTGEIDGFTQSYWGGVTTLELAKAIDKSMDNNLSGVVHLTNGDKISKYDLINLFKEIWNRNSVHINKVSGKLIDRSLIKSGQFDFDVPDYKQMLLDQKSWMDSHAHLYNKIYADN